MALKEITDDDTKDEQEEDSVTDSATEEDNNDEQEKASDKASEVNRGIRAFEQVITSGDRSRSSFEKLMNGGVSTDYQKEKLDAAPLKTASTFEEVKRPPTEEDLKTRCKEIADQYEKDDNEDETASRQTAILAYMMMELVKKMFGVNDPRLAQPPTQDAGPIVEEFTVDHSTNNKHTR